MICDEIYATLVVSRNETELQKLYNIHFKVQILRNSHLRKDWM